MRLMSILSLVVASMFAPISPLVADDDGASRALAAEEIVIEGRRNLSRQIKNGFAAFRAGDFKKAESYFYRVRAGYQLQASITFQEFGDMWNFSNLTGGVGVYTTTADQEVRRALSIIQYMEGMSQRAQGELASARRSFKRAIKLNPGHFDARADLSLVEIERGERDNAEKHIRRLAKDLGRCPQRAAETCDAIRDRLWQVEAAYGAAS